MGPGGRRGSGSAQLAPHQGLHAGPKEAGSRQRVTPAAPSGLLLPACTWGHQKPPAPAHKDHTSHQQPSHPQRCRFAGSGLVPPETGACHTGLGCRRGSWWGILGYHTRESRP